MAHTNLVLGKNWHNNEWPESIDAMHEGTRDSLKYVPKRTTRLIWDEQDECWKCEACKEDWGEIYFMRDCIPYRMHYCSSCGAEVI